MVILYNVLAALINVFVVIAFKVLSIHGAILPSSAGFIRNTFGLITFLPFIIFHLTKNYKLFYVNVPHKMNLLLGFVGGISMIIWPIVYINIDTHIAMTFAFLLPFIANLMLKFFCKEEIPTIAWVSKILCLIAVLIILQPTFAEWNHYHNLGIICVLLWAVCAVFQKNIGKSSVSTYIALYWYIFFTTITTIFFSMKFFNSVDWSFTWYFLAIGFLNSVGNLFTFLAFKHGKGYFVQMMEFIKFIMIIFVDINFFNAHVTIYTVIGVIIITFAILLLIFKEYKKA
jgi:drug/metabolite transporter (DMT)-like permease